MTPRERHLHDAQVSLHRQQQLLDDRYQRDSERLAQSVEEDLVNRFRCSLRVQPATAEEEAIIGGASSFTAAATMPPAATRPWQPESLPLTRNRRSSSPCLQKRGDGERCAEVDPRGDYPPPRQRGATDRRHSSKRWLAKKVPKHVKRYFFVDEQGRADMSYRNTPDSEKPPGAPEREWARLPTQPTLSRTPMVLAIFWTMRILRIRDSIREGLSPTLGR